MERRALGRGNSGAGGKTRGWRSGHAVRKGVLDVDAREDTSPDKDVRGANLIQASGGGLGRQPKDGRLPLIS